MMSGAKREYSSQSEGQLDQWRTGGLQGHPGRHPALARRRADCVAVENGKPLDVTKHTLTSWAQSFTIKVCLTNLI
jgi:hypothetical protein